MNIARSLFSVAMAMLFAAPSAIHSQTNPPEFHPVPTISFDNSLPVLRAHTEALKPFTVSGERGVLLGQQDGTFETWLLPVKVLSHLTIQADVENYTVPVDVNQQSAEVEVRPDRTIITYAHIGFTVRQIMFSPANGPAGTGPVVLFQFDCVRPTDFTLRFTPELRWMWPERSEGTPNIEWVAPGQNPHDVAGGFYVLHADYPDLAAAITIPGARAGILAPYQERPQVHPVELKLHIDPTRDRNKLYPLLMAVGKDVKSANTAALGATLQALNDQIATTYAAHAESYKKLLANSVSIETPDKDLDQAFQWAVVSIEQLKAKPWVPKSIDATQPPTSKEPTTAPTANPRSPSSVSGHDFSRADETHKEDGALAPAKDETALVAGYYASGDSARPGFGWFFGRDALYTLYAVNGYGDFALSKSELEFLIRRQRADGKIMHEYSQTAGAIDWQQFPYMYAAADATPLFLLAMLDYVRSSGDTDFLKAHRDAVEKAWVFETSHTDTNGIYTNEQGTGWVESWPGGLPHQEIYLALLDQQASAAMAQLSTLLHDEQGAQSAKSRATSLAKTINDQFYDAEKGCYAFSRNKDGSLDRTTTVYPALAWWSALPGTSDAPGDGSILAHPQDCLKQFASAALNTDWGLRDVSNKEKIYDGMSYHQGSVWPLFTGWAALAEYRGNQPLAGYQMLKENANLTTAQDIGAVTELLSGDFFVPFGRSTSHQLWSSAMVITPTLRGLFGIDIDAQTKTITVNPHLPASWDHAVVNHLPLPSGDESLWFERKGQKLLVSITDWHKNGWRIVSSQANTVSGKLDTGFQGVQIPLELIEVIDGRFSQIDISTDSNHFVSNSTFAPLPGSRTEHVRMVSEHWSDHEVKLVFEGPGGATGSYFIRRHALVPQLKINCPKVKVRGPNDYSMFIPCTSMIDSGLQDPNVPIQMHLQLPEGEGWKTITVTLTW